MTQSKNESALMWAIKTTFSQSMTLNHWNYRLHLFSTWPTIWGHRKFHGITWYPLVLLARLTNFRVHFYNRILLLILDVILGLTIGYYVWHNHFWVIEIAGQAYQWLRQNVLEVPPPPSPPSSPWLISFFLGLHRLADGMAWWIQA